jgi:diguanylate cyclase (GGDEF)-like protein/PAS domain S-box-containing protein
VGDDVPAFLDSETGMSPLPEWIRSGGGSSRTHAPGQRLAATHPDDRQKVIDLWWEAVGRPGEVCEVECLIQGEEGWSRELVRQVNLLDQDDIGAMVVAVRFLGTAEGVNLPEVIQAGEYEEVDLLIHELDETGVIIKTEGKVFEISGRTPEEVIGQSVLDHIHPDGFNDAISMWMEVITGPPGTTRSGRQRVVRPDGSMIWTEATTIKRVAEDGTVTATVICRDLSELSRQESALRISQLEFRLLADQVPSAVFQADGEQRVTFRNSRWADLLEDGAPVEHLYDIVHDDDRATYDSQIERLVSSPSRTAEFEVRSRDGERVYSIMSQAVFDVVNDTRSFVGAVTDITSTVELRQRAERDPLTGLLNRAALVEHLQHALRNDSERTTVVFIDLDEFKSVNDTYGHHVGDDVLITIARRLTDTVRADDVVARFGGDEFVIVLHNAGLGDHAIVERLQLAFQPPIDWSGGTWKPKASIGVAHPQGDDVNAVLRDADLEMFASKRQRRLSLT